MTDIHIEHPQADTGRARDAIELVLARQVAGVELLSEDLDVDAVEAGRLLDWLTDRGIVGPDRGGSTRAVLLPRDGLDAALARAGLVGGEPAATVAYLPGAWIETVPDQAGTPVADAGQGSVDALSAAGGDHQEQPAAPAPATAGPAGGPVDLAKPATTPAPGRVPPMPAQAPLVGAVLTSAPELAGGELVPWWQRELHRVAPAGFEDWPAARRTLAQARAVVANRLAFHSVRTPRYLLRVAGLALFGARVTVRDARHYLMAGEYTGEIRTARREKDNERVENLRLERHVTIRNRWRSRRAVAGLLLGGGYALALGGAVAAGAGQVADPMAVVAGLACVTVGYRERREASGEFALLAPLPDQSGPMTDERITAALRAVGLLKTDESIRPIGLIGREKTGPVTAQVALFDGPPGLTAQRVASKTVEIAGALGVDQVQLDIRQDGPAGRTSLWLADADPLAGARRSPLLARRARIDAWTDGVPVAFDRRGVELRLRVKDSSYLVGGVTRSGKGIAIMSLILGALFDPRVRVRLVDGKASGEYNQLAKMLNSFVKGDPRRLAALLVAEVREMGRRMTLLSEAGAAKLTPALLGLLGGLDLLIIDELATYTSTEEIRLALHELGDYDTDPAALREEIIGALMQLSAKGAAAGIVLVLSTQVPEVAVIPARLRSNVTSRWAMRTESAQQSNNILGNGMSATANAADVPLSRRGGGFLMTPEYGVRECRSFLIDDEAGEVAKIAGVVHELRAKAGVLPDEATDRVEQALFEATGASSLAGGIGHPGVIRPGRAAGVHGLLAQVLAVFAAAGDPDRLTTAQIVAGLGEADPEVWGEVAAGSLAAAGAALARGIEEQLADDAATEHREPRELTAREWRTGGRARGYLLADVRAAVGLDT